MSAAGLHITSSLHHKNHKNCTKVKVLHGNSKHSCTLSKAYSWISKCCNVHAS
jgi:metal-responsive CopG/Arc/MetJ family transcriptional regulator